jgi:hypothetical protein
MATALGGLVRAFVVCYLTVAGRFFSKVVPLSLEDWLGALFLRNSGFKRALPVQPSLQPDSSY